MNHYTQLTENQRYQIYTMKKACYSQSAMADELGVHKSTISRELSRNSGLRGYRPKQAHQLCLNRRVNKKPVRIVESHWAEIERLIKLYWSPQQISNRLLAEQDYRISLCILAIMNTYSGDREHLVIPRIVLSLFLPQVFTIRQQSLVFFALIHP